MGAYNGAEVCEIVGLSLVNNLANKFDKIGLAYIETMDLPYSKIFPPKEFHQTEEKRKEKRIIFRN